MFHSLGYIGSLCRFVAATQHYDQHGATLNVIHAPTGPEVFAHFKHATTYRPNITEIAKRRLAQSRQQTAVSHPIRKTEQLRIKVFSSLDRKH